MSTPLKSTGSSRAGGLKSTLSPSGIRQRGLYGDLSSSLEESTSGPADRMTLGASAPRMPLAHTLRPPVTDSGTSASASLSSSSSAGAAESRFSRAAEPKVFVPHERREGVPPRKVEVERRKRQYAALELDKLLKDREIDYSKKDMIPYGLQIADIPLKSSIRSSSSSSSYISDIKLKPPKIALSTTSLPLEAFDNADYESRSPVEWLTLAAADSKSGGRGGVPGKGLFICGDHSGVWRACRAIAYDIESSMFLVEWEGVLPAEAAAVVPIDDEKKMRIDDGHEDDGDGHRKDKDDTVHEDGGDDGKMEGKSLDEAKIEDSLRRSHDRKEKETSEAVLLYSNLTLGDPRQFSSTSFCWLHRLSLCFVAEDPLKFADRVSFAHKNRSKALDTLKYHFCIDSMPADDVPTPGLEEVQRVLQLVFATRPLRGVTIDPTSLVEEISIDYGRTMNKIIFDLALKSASLSSGAVGGAGALLKSIGSPVDTPRKVIPEHGTISTPPHDFAEVFAQFSFHSQLTQNEIIQVLVKARIENFRLFKISFLATAATKPQRLDEFEQSQAQATLAYSSMLKEGWVQSVKSHVRHCLGSVGKGWYNLKETSAEVYKFSKLRRHLVSVNFIMEDSLRYAVEEMLSGFYDYIMNACAHSVVVDSTSKVSVIPTPGFSRRNPLFTVDITIRDRKAEEAELALAALGSTGGKRGGLGSKKTVGTAGAPAATAKKDAGGAGKKADTSKSTAAAVAEVEDDEVKSVEIPDIFAAVSGTHDDFDKTFIFSSDPKSFVTAPYVAAEAAIGSIHGITQVERLVMDRLFWPRDPTITSVHWLEQWVVELMGKMKTSLEHTIIPLEKYLHLFDTHLRVMNTDIDAYLRDVEEKSKGEDFKLSQLIDKAAKHRAEALLINDSIPSTVHVGLFQIGLSEVRTLLQQRHTQVADGLLHIVAQQASTISAEIVKSYREMERALSQYPKDIEQLTEIKEYMASCPDKVKELQRRHDANSACYAALDKFRAVLTKEQIELQWQAAKGPRAISEKVEAVTETLSSERTRYMEDMEREQQEFDAHLNTLYGEVVSLATHTDISKVHQVAAVVSKLKRALEAAKERVNLFNTREGLFSRPSTEYDRLAEIQKLFDPYCILWETADSWLKWYSSWTTLPFMQLDPDVVERDHGNALRNASKSVKAFEKIGNAGCLEIAAELKRQMEAFRPTVPLIQALRNPGMRDRHWADVSEATKIKVVPSDTLTLQVIWDMRLNDHIDAITKVGEKAAKEYQIEVALDKMEAAWESVNLIIDPYRETGTYILKGIDDLQTLLDEHTTMTAAMQFSTFKKHFEDRISAWSQALNTITDVLDQWIKVQRSWLYLQPIFDSQDIQKQLPKEYKRFCTVDKNWRQTMQAAKSSSKAIKFCNNEKLLERFVESNTFLDLVQKELSDYLETKRSAFPRFYFLSDDELLNILSSTKDPRAVQQHLKKCFEGLNKVEFTKDLCISKMISEEGERIEFEHPVDPKGKNVEHWMTELEDAMRKNLKRVLLDSIEAYTTNPRIQWMQQWPGQPVINASQLHWTRVVEELIKEKGARGVIEAYQLQVSQLQDMVKLVRGKLESLVRMTISALTVIDVHARDVTKRLVDTNVSAVNDFDWISQMRYSWIGATATPYSGDMFVTMISSVRPYGYEYLGNTTRLVITPLTDKCYMTLMGALQMHLGGAPAGPAGTGKTETVKDLAKALAKQCVVFNCSDGLDYLAMGKFFKGLASCGAWACFDEFNRIDIEVLSVIAQQMMTLQAGINAGAPRITFMDAEIKLDSQFATFITMNPGYAGRTELPDNLKALFRPVAMMVPDYALIGEIMLISYGFEKALLCARKMVATFKLCSEQLSSQNHYDYGMRAVKTVITAAGNLKRADPDMDEERLLYRALQDVNLPKFLAHDIPLFNGIISDLFPGTKRPEIDYGDLMKALTLCAERNRLQPTPIFLSKCIQLYETILVRHGLMLVGPTGGGKSCVTNVLKDSLTLLNAKGKVGNRYEKVHTFIVNPKAVTMGQLYGQFDVNTHEWVDGILAGLVRECADAQTVDLRWIVFDGPVDALWIENMNTVLDDNKKLCLVSGEIIKLTPYMEMMFEVEDLLVASPATVSRCGMVYMEPSALGIDVLLQSWLEKLPACFDGTLKALLQYLFDIYVRGALYYLRKYLSELLPTVDNQLVRGLLNLMDCFFEPFIPKEGRDLITADQIKQLSAQVPPYFMFSLVWSIAGTTNADGRRRFDVYLRSEMLSHSFNLPFPASGNVYDYTFKPSEMKWTPWMDTIEPYSIAPKTSFAEIVVPTKDSVRAKWLVGQLILNRKNSMLAGPTGTGKTAGLMGLVSTGLPKEYVPITLAFSAQTSANQTQDIVDSKMERRQRGTYGPTAGTFYIFFVDDLNMPEREKFFAQPPLELLRQWFDYGGWYDRKERSFRKIVDTIFVTAAGPPGGGRSKVSPRVLRHIHVIGCTPMDDDSLFVIFSTILTSFLYNFDVSVSALVKSTVLATIQSYNAVMSVMLPTPATPHYTFNLRDLAKVFQGLLEADNKKITAPKDFLKIWVHECRRVFMDRLVKDADRNQFNNILKDKMENIFRLSWDDIIPSTRLLFGDYGTPGVEPRIYDEIRDVSSIIPIIQEYLSDYNTESKTPMKLVMFLDAIEHVSKISRILRLPQGHALLLGVGGSGRQSLSKLATFMAEMTLFQIEISKGYGKLEWREDLKGVLMRAGVQEKPTVFLFNDSQIVFGGMLEDINSVLNSGDVPNLYLAEDLDNIMQTCRKECTSRAIIPTKINIFAQYLIRVRKNIHIVLCMSPMGEKFRTRLRMFPALVNCCTIDWFSEWPAEALQSVAEASLADIEDSLGDHTDSIVSFFRLVHLSVAESSELYYKKLKRRNFVTPTSYLELLSTFKKVLLQKRAEVGMMKSRLQNGLDKLISTADEVAILQEGLKDLEPKLIETQKSVETMLVQIEIDKTAAAETKVIVEHEESEATKMAAETKAIADDAQADLDRALPALDDAVKAVKLLDKKDFDELRSVRTPGKGVVLTMHACCILFGVKPDMKADVDPMKKVKDFWEPAKRYLLADARKFKSDMENYDKDNIQESIIDDLRPFVADEMFTPDAVKKSNMACMNMCKWVHAMFLYSVISKEVEPKRRRLALAQENLDRTMAQLNAAKARLSEVESKIAKLTAEFDAADLRKKQLQEDVDTCRARLDRAHKLIGGLGGEKTRWAETVTKLSIDHGNLLGDCLVSSSSIAYLGAFTSQFRKDLVKQWQSDLLSRKVPHTVGCDLIRTLADPVKVRSWNISGLPTDFHSIENGIILSVARRWPLMIDPQGQANKWIKNMGRDRSLAPNDIEVLRQSDKKFLQALENGIRFGKWVLLENIQESIEAALEPILQRQTFKQGGAEMIKLGDSVVPYNDDFKFFLTTKLPNPYYAPEVCVKVSLLNFTITPQGLEDQMLGTFVVTELPELEERKNTLVQDTARMKKELLDIENKILALLSAAKGNILDDEELIETLAQSKSTSKEITSQVIAAEETEKEIDSTREKYRPVAFRASLLYFCIAELSDVDPMYQYSLVWFTDLFINSIKNSEPSEDIEKRIVSLNGFFTYLIYVNVCRSMFEVHKLLLSFMLCIKIMQGNKQVDADEWKFFISGQGPVSLGDVGSPTAGSGGASQMNPDPSWITDPMWREICILNRVPTFSTLVSGFDRNLKEWRILFDSFDAHQCPLAGEWESDKNLSNLGRMCILRCLRPDKMILAIQDFVIENLGQKYIEPPPFNLSACYDDSTVTSPLIFVLSTGSDPTRAFYTFAESVGMRSKLEGISLGQGQGEIASRMIEKAQVNGEWVLLQNCHLAASWMTELERICEAIDKDKVSPDFRLWLTSMPSKEFPPSVLQNGVKMTSEPPKGLRANLRNFYFSLSDEELQITHKPEAYRKLLFGLAFFHANVLERKKYGPLGWNRPYEFNSSDLEISRRQLEMFLDEYPEIPYRVLNFLTSYINYGGRVTDDKDLRTIDVILLDYFAPEIQDEGYKFSSSGTYYSITADDEHPHKSYTDFIDHLPLNAEPEVFGMHSNANITCDQNESYSMCSIIVSLQPRTGGAEGKPREEIIADTCKDILDSLPDRFDVDSIAMTYPVKYEESMNTVLVQECIRYNRLTNEMKSTLVDIQKALKGLVVMSTELDAMGVAIATQRVPELWENVAYPSLKPLGGWVAELLERLSFISQWVEKGSPPVLWISGFYFPQAFLTGTLQNFARRYAIPIDTISFDFSILDQTVEELKEKPLDGCYIRGLYLEGARFDMKTHFLAESIPKQLYTQLPIIHLIPKPNRVQPSKGIYQCPVYKILSRWGVLATTGHSSNFVMWIEVPSDRGDTLNSQSMPDSDFWIKAGVAAFCSLRY